MALLIPYAILTQGIYSGVISTISTVTIGTCRLVTSIYTYKNPNVTAIIKELDIDRRLTLIQAVLNSIDHVTHHEAKLKLDDLEKTQIFELVGSEADYNTDPIELCLHYLHEVIQDIHLDLTDIASKVAYHDSRWFSSWRTLNLTTQLASLSLNSRLLESRFDDLTKISLFLANIKKVH